MLTTVLCAALSATIFVGSTLAAAEYRPGISVCRPTLEKWLASHGAKLTGREQWGAFVTGKVRWDNGVIAEVTVGPAVDPDTGKPAICVLASRYLGREEVRAEVVR